MAPPQPAKLTDEQIARYIDAFYHFDTDRDDFINRDELFALVEFVQIQVDPDRLINLLKDLQINKDRIDKREVLRLAKVLNEKAQPKVETPTTTRSRMMNFSAIDITNKVSAWIDGDGAKPTATASFFGARSSQPAKPNGEVVIEIDNDSSDEESDFEYYTDSGSDEDVALISKGKLPVDSSLKPSPSGEGLLPASAGSSPGRSRAASVSKESSPGRSRAPSTADEKRPLRPISKTNVTPAEKKTRTRGRQIALNAQNPKRALAGGADEKAKMKKSPAAALADPKVRKQLAKIKEYEPNFLRFITLVEVLVMVFEIIYNGGFESITVNPLAGPKAITLIQLGGLYPPCMKADPTITADFSQPCAAGIPVVLQSNDGTCLYSQNMLYICGLGGFSVRYQPDQVWRLVSAMFLHTGVVHFLMNLLVIIRIGFPMERQMGTLRMIVIYLLSGISGNIFAANMSPTSVSTGSSGPLYAYFAMLYLDLANNWPIVRKPWENFAKISLGVFLALAIGLLPLIANYDHIGGFLSGICLGLMLMPTVHFNKWDHRRKRILKLISLPALVVGMALGLYSFFSSSTNYCPWCQYLDCLPPGAKWCQT